MHSRKEASYLLYLFEKQCTGTYKNTYTKPLSLSSSYNTFQIAIIYTGTSIKCSYADLKQVDNQPECYGFIN